MKNSERSRQQKPFPAKGTASVGIEGQLHTAILATLWRSASASSVGSWDNREAQKG